MKGKKMRKRVDENHGEVRVPKIEGAPSLPIKFDLREDNIACFIGEKRANRAQGAKRVPSVRKSKASLAKLQPKTEKVEIVERKAGGGQSPLETL